MICYKHLCGEDCDEHGAFKPSHITPECNYGDPNCSCLTDDSNGDSGAYPCSHGDDGLFVDPEHVEAAIGRRVCRVLTDVMGDLAQRANARHNPEPCTLEGQKKLTVDLFGTLKLLDEARKIWLPRPTN